MITSEQIRAARALLRIGQSELAGRSRVPLAAIRRVEAVGGIGRVAPATVEAIAKALEESGAEFIENGVRRRQPPSRHDPEARYRLLRAIAERSAGQLASLPAFDEADLYDDQGLPA